MFAKENKFLSLLLCSSLLLALPVNAQDTRSNCAYADDETPRRRPGRPAHERPHCEEDGLRPAIWQPLPELVAIPDRWRIVTALGYPESKLDPYHGNNVLKGDRPAFGEDWFFSLGMISDSTFEARSVPTPVASATPPSPDDNDLPHHGSAS